MNSFLLLKRWGLSSDTCWLMNSEIFALVSPALLTKFHVKAGVLEYWMLISSSWLAEMFLQHRKHQDLSVEIQAFSDLAC